MVENAVLVAFVIAAMYTDLRWRRIPNVITFPAMAAGLVFGALEGIPGAPMAGGLLDHIAALALAFAITYPLAQLRLGLGAGDAKFLMAIGALGGVSFFVPAALYGSVVGGVLALVLIVLRRLDPPETETPGRIRRVMMSRIPYGVALGIGALIALWLLP